MQKAMACRHLGVHVWCNAASWLVDTWGYMYMVRCNAGAWCNLEDTGMGLVDTWQLQGGYGAMLCAMWVQRGGEV